MCIAAAIEPVGFLTPPLHAPSEVAQLGSVKRPRAVGESNGDSAGELSGCSLPLLLLPEDASVALGRMCTDVSTRPEGLRADEPAALCCEACCAAPRGSIGECGDPARSQAELTSWQAISEEHDYAQKDKSIRAAEHDLLLAA